MKVIVGMETSGAIRRAFQQRGHYVISVDLLPSTDGCEGLGPEGGHLIGDVFEVISQYPDHYFDLGIFHPTCTYLTCSAEWAYKDPDYERYPEVGYHQKLKPGTLFGEERREAREEAIKDFDRILKLPIRKKVVENPVGVISKAIRKPDQVIQPWMFGDDASKATCLWLEELPLLVVTDPLPAPRVIAEAPFEGQPNWKVASRYSNQTDSGQSNVPPSKDRWQLRSNTYPGIATALAEQYG